VRNFKKENAEPKERRRHFMRCKDCPYWWIDDEEPYCHYQYNDGYAPCEVDETEYLNEENDEDE
jgi:hypothetical protein